ncbi:MAG: hypothetical protein FWC38_08390 [Proteobacteria bacterium]|nr:hypothetical protein [Pseudomonadota bacterium]MCL2308218.1 hypothetical protein [Pseudomonadota bacterium]
MRTTSLVLLICLLLGGCSTQTTKVYESGAKASVTAHAAPAQEHTANVRYASKKYSENLHDYQQAYILAFLEAQETDAFAPDKPRLPLFEAGSSLAAISALGLALDAAGSVWASNLFSPKFLAGGVVLGLLTPKSEERQFVDAATQSWRLNNRPSVRYVLLTPLLERSPQVIDKTNELWFENTDSFLNRAGVRCEFEPRKGELVFIGYRRLMSKKCWINDIQYSLFVDSVFAAEESNTTKRFGHVVISKMWIQAPTDDLVEQAVVKLRPFVDENWIVMFTGNDTTGVRRMFVGKGEDMAMFDLPPEPFKKGEKSGR